MSYNDPCNGGCGNSKRDCTCVREKPKTGLERDYMKKYREDDDFLEFLGLINEWHTEPEARESYPDGLSQLLEESSINPKRYALLLVEYLYKSSDLNEIIRDYNNLKK